MHFCIFPLLYILSEDDMQWNKQNFCYIRRGQLWCLGTQGPLWSASTAHFTEMGLIITFLARGRGAWCLPLRLLDYWDNGPQELGFPPEFSCWESGVTNKRCHTVLTAGQTPSAEETFEQRQRWWQEELYQLDCLVMHISYPLLKAKPWDGTQRMDLGRGGHWNLFRFFFRMRLLNWMNLLSQLFTVY